VTIVVAPQYLSNGSLLGTTCLEPNLWMGCAYFAILAIKRDDPRNWLWFASSRVWACRRSIQSRCRRLASCRLLLTEQRRVFADKWIWLGGARGLTGLPAQFPVERSLPLAVRRIDAEHQGRGSRFVLGALPYFFQQTLLVLPLTAPSDHWLDCALLLATTEDLSRARLELPVCYTVFFVLHGKNYYLARSIPCSWPQGGDHRECNRPPTPHLDEARQS